MMSAFECFHDVLALHRFCGIVTNAAGRSQKNHCGRNFLRKDHGVMSGAARHPVRLTTSFPDGLFDLPDEKTVHRDRRLSEKYPPLYGYVASRGNGFGLAR